MILSDPQRALATVESLSELGVRFAVDDFGTGHSSLANLRMLPVHELKIDRSFVTPMLNEDSDGVIVRSTIELGHALGLKVIAEGVEDARTLARLEEIHCDRAQGHFFSKPIPPIEFMRWISRYEASYLSAALRSASPVLTPPSCGGAASCRPWCACGERACERGLSVRSPASPAQYERC